MRLSQNARTWFATLWQGDVNGARVALADYATIGAQHRGFIIDVAMRGSVFTPIDAATDREAAIAEGRRQLALEIFKLCKVDPRDLFDLVPKLPREEKSS